jgi:DNA-binding NarL/FixJ family response regulator
MAPMMVSPAIRVTVVGNSPLLFLDLVALIDGHEDMRAVAVARTPGHCRDVETDVAVVGLEGLSVDTATRTIAGLRARSDTKIVAVVDGADEVMGWVVAAHVDACLDFETVDAHALVDAVRSVAGRRPIISNELLSELRQRERSTAPGTPLTPPEREVLALLADGHSNESIARHLELQVDTLRVSVSGIIAKLVVANRNQAAQQ